jgi:hypothetical protein
MSARWEPTADRLEQRRQPLRRLIPLGANRANGNCVFCEGNYAKPTSLTNRKISQRLVKTLQKNELKSLYDISHNTKFVVLASRSLLKRHPPALAHCFSSGCARCFSCFDCHSNNNAVFSSQATIRVDEMDARGFVPNYLSPEEMQQLIKKGLIKGTY